MISRGPVGPGKYANTERSTEAARMFFDPNPWTPKREALWEKYSWAEMLRFLRIAVAEDRE